MSNNETAYPLHVLIEVMLEDIADLFEKEYTKIISVPRQLRGCAATIRELKASREELLKNLDPEIEITDEHIKEWEEKKKNIPKSVFDEG